MGEILGALMATPSSRHLIIPDPYENMAWLIPADYDASNSFPQPLSAVNSSIVREIRVGHSCCLNACSVVYPTDSLLN